MISAMAKILLLFLIFTSNFAIAVTCPNNAIYSMTPGAPYKSCHTHFGTAVSNSLDSVVQFGGGPNTNSVKIINYMPATTGPQAVNGPPLYTGSLQKQEIKADFPKNIGDLVAWYDASSVSGKGDVVGKNNNVLKIIDKSDRKLDLIRQSSAAATGQDDKSIANSPVKTIYCNGSNYYVTTNITPTSYANGITVFVVANSISPNSVIVQHGNPASPNNWSFNTTGSKDNFTANAGAINITGSLTNASAFVDGNRNLKISVAHITPSNSSAYLWQNFAAGNYTPTGSFGNNSNQISLCGTSSGGSLYTGNIAEVIIYSKALSADQIHAMFSYLSKKWLNNQASPDCKFYVETYDANKLVTGSVMPTWPNANRGQTITFNCASSGVTTNTCSASGWGGASACSSTTCTNASIPTVANGSFSPAGATTANSATITGTCSSGYIGSPTVVCNNGSWGSVSGSCSPGASCNTNNISNPHGVTDIAPNVTVASGATYSAGCGGYGHYKCSTGTSSTTCNNGTWSALSYNCNCVCNSDINGSYCANASCNTNNISNPHGVTDIAPNVTVASGATYSAGCGGYGHYKCSTGTSSTTCNNGTWSALSYNCNCVCPSDINGSYCANASCNTNNISNPHGVSGIAPNVIVASGATYTSAGGYNGCGGGGYYGCSTGTTAATCNNGTWSALSYNCTCVCDSNYGSYCEPSTPSCNGCDDDGTCRGQNYVRYTGDCGPGWTGAYRERCTYNDSEGYQWVEDGDTCSEVGYNDQS
jgi:hypothetical protein